MCSCIRNPFFICLPMTSGGDSWSYDVTVYQNWQAKMLTFQHSCDRISLLKLQHPREPLNKSSAAVSGSFPPILPYRKREILTVLRRFRYFDWPENLSLTALADLIILFLNKMISSFYSAVSRQTAWAAVRNVLASFLAAVAAGRNPAA